MAKAKTKKKTKRSSTKSQASIYKLKIALENVAPPIWRRLEVPSDITLDRLHLVFQVAMGWENYHLWSFEKAKQTYGPEDPTGMLDVQGAPQTRLSDLVSRTRQSFVYVYDYGDDWQHKVVVEGVSAPEAATLYPRCTGGKRACPPEDCGGAWGYARFLEIISDPDDEEHEEMLDWAGGEFDPEAFDLKHHSREIQRLAAPKPAPKKSPKKTVRPAKRSGDGKATKTSKKAAPKPPSKAQLKRMVEEATVDAYNEYEQTTGFECMLSDELELPFQTEVLEKEVTVERIEATDRADIVAICKSGRTKQKIRLLDLPLPSPPPKGWQWIEAYRHWYGE